MAVLTKEQILGVQDLIIERVDVPEWGGVVCVRPITGTDRDSLEIAFKDTRIGFRARLAAKSICDESGQRIFTDADVLALGEKNATALDRVITVALRLAGMTEAAAEEAEKNLMSCQSGDSGSD